MEGDDLFPSFIYVIISVKLSAKDTLVAILVREPLIHFLGPSTFKIMARPLVIEQNKTIVIFFLSKNPIPSKKFKI